MDNNPDSPDSISSDQLTVDLLSPRSKRRRMVVINNVDTCEMEETADIGKNGNANNNNNNNNSSTNNNDVGFVLMEEEHQENGENDDDDVCAIVHYKSDTAARAQ